MYLSNEWKFEIGVNRSFENTIFATMMHTYMYIIHIQSHYILAFILIALLDMTCGSIMVHAVEP